MLVSRENIRQDILEDFPVEARFLKLPIPKFLDVEKIEPNPPQMAIINAINNPSYRFVVACVSRRVGKSFIAYTIAFLKALEPNNKVLIVAPNYSLAEIGWAHIKSLIKKYELETEKENAKDREIVLANGTLIKLASATKADSAVGRSYDLIVFEEAALSDKGGDAFNIQLRPTLDKPNSKCLFISTPRGQNWFKEFYERGYSDDAKLSRWVSIHATWQDNPRASLEDIEEAKSTVSKAYFEQEYMASFSVFEGMVFDAFEDDRNIVHLNADYEVDEIILGIDPGYRDPTAGVVVEYNEEAQTYTIIEEYEQAEAKTGIHGAHFQEWYDKYDPYYVFIDSAAAQFREDLACDYEVPSAPAKKSLLDGINFIHTLIQHGKLKVSANCPRTIECLKNYRWDEKAGLVKERPVHDWTSHLVDAVRYAIYSHNR